MIDDEHYITPEAMRILTRYPGDFGPGPWPLEMSQLGWGLTCGDAWYPILDRLFADIDRIREEDGLTRLEVSRRRRCVSSRIV